MSSGVSTEKPIAKYSATVRTALYPMQTMMEKLPDDGVSAETRYQQFTFHVDLNATLTRVDGTGGFGRKGMEVTFSRYRELPGGKGHLYDCLRGCVIKPCVMQSADVQPSGDDWWKRNDAQHPDMHNFC